VIIYAAGSNSMEWAEANPREADRTHTGGAATVANAFDIMQHKFIYLSNCYTFDGLKGNYHESDVLLPVAALGKSKVGGENFIRGKSLNYVILRSSPVYGRSNGLNLSLLDRIRMSLDRKQRIELPTEEIHSFAPVYGLIDLILRIIESGIRNKVLHYGGLTKVSHVDFGKAFARRFGYDPELVIPRPRSTPRQQQPASEDFARDFSLNSSVAAELLRIKPYNLEEGFEVLDKQLTLVSRGG
jgi:dTDP-4-dehydrorhamnose reductase